MYYANLTRALLNEEITKNRFFKLCRCINNLTEEDLVYFKADITKNGKTTIKEDRDTIDDFRSVGLLMEVNEGFAYTHRAFELLKYAVDYENEVIIPNDFPERIMISTPTWKDIDKIFNVEGETLKINAILDKDE